MCQEDSAVRLSRCSHGTFHLTVGLTTLHMCPKQMALVANAIYDWVERNTPGSTKPLLGANPTGGHGRRDCHHN